MLSMSCTSGHSLSQPLTPTWHNQIGLGKKKSEESYIVARPRCSWPFHVPLLLRLSNEDSTLLYANTPNPFQAMLEMSPDRYIHTRGVYRCNVLEQEVQIVESSEPAKNKASIYAFLKYVIRFHACRSDQLLRATLPQRGSLNAKLRKFFQGTIECAEKHEVCVKVSAIPLPTNFDI